VCPCPGVSQMLSYYSTSEVENGDGSDGASTSYDGHLNSLPEHMRLTREDIRR
jgi:hypothetical protein